MEQSTATRSIMVKRLKLSDQLERVRQTLSMGYREWCDYIEVTESDYRKIRWGIQDVSLYTLNLLCDRLNLSMQKFICGQVDFHALAARLKGQEFGLPEKYLNTAFSRRWSSVNFLKYIEDSLGWRARSEALRFLEVPEVVFQQPDEKISLRFVIDLLDFVGKHYVSGDHFYTMGAYSVITYQNSPLGAQLRQVGDLSKIYEVLFEDLISRLLEKNCRYRLIRLSQTECVIEALETPGLAEAMGLRTLATPFLCRTKVGLTASIPGYLGLPFGDAHEVTCRFRGDPTCRYQVNFERAQAVFLRGAAT